MSGVFTKWNGLSNELKSMCIEKLDLKTRARMRQTSRLEKSLVDSLKLRNVSIDFSGDEFMSVVKVDGDELQFEPENYSKMVLLSSQILNTGNIDVLDFGEDNKSENNKRFEEELGKIGKIRVKHLKINSKTKEVREKIVEKAIPNVQTIQILTVLSETSFVTDILDNWVKEGAGIGKSIQFFLPLEKGTFGKIKELFKESISSQTPIKNGKLIRIKTKDAAKHVSLLMKLHKEKWEFFKIHVVSADSEDVGVDDDEWISKLDHNYETVSVEDLMNSVMGKMMSAQLDDDMFPELQAPRDVEEVNPEDLAEYMEEMYY